MPSDTNTTIGGLGLINVTKIYNAIEQIKSSTRFLREYEQSKKREDFGDWESRFISETEKLVDKNFNVVVKNLQNFRGQQIFVADRPAARFRSFYNESKTYYALKRTLNLFLGTVYTAESTKSRS